eukprot:3870111-Karenia_brevis.AAC.1
MNAFDRLLGEAEAGLRRPAASQWNSPWLNVVFGGGEDSLSFLSSSVPSPPLPSINSSPAERTRPSSSKVGGGEMVAGDVLRGAKRRRREDETVERNGVLRLWLELFSNMKEVSDGVAKVLACEGGDAQLEMVDDMFYDRRAKTLIARAGSLELFLKWFRSTSSSSPFPINEECVYRYLRELYLEKAPATRAQRFRECLGFLKHIVGVKMSEE